MMSYADSRVERLAWTKERDAVEAGWAVIVRPVLAERGRALTSELAHCAGIKPGRHYERFVYFLRRHFQAVGKEKGPTNQMNTVWMLRDDAGSQAL